MKKSMFFTVLCAIILNVYAQSQTWTAMQMPEISSKWTLTGIYFSSPSNGWAVGYDYEDVGTSTNVVKGVILQFKEGQWIKANYPTPSANWTLHGVWFLNDKEGWAYGQNKENKAGLLMHYKNDTWKVVELSMVSYKEWVLYDVFFVNEKLGWAVGSTWGDEKPVFLTHTDGSWKVEDVADLKKQTLLSVAAINADNVFAGGFREGKFDMAGISRAQGSYIITKTKGNWEQPKLPLLSNNVICRDIACIDASNVYAVGWMPAFQSAPETGKILFYNGKKWSEADVDAGKDWNIFGVAFENAQTGWAAGNYSGKNKGLLIQFNKGEWKPLSKKTEPQIAEKWNLRSITFDKQGAYYAAGGDEQSNKGIIIKTEK